VRSKTGHWQANQKRDFQALHQQNSKIAARHGKSTVGQIDEIHQAHRHCQANSQNKEQHAVGNTVKQDGQHE